MAAGRPPKPTHLKVIAGNPGKRALPTNEPQPELRDLEPPRDLDEDEQREWDRIAPLLRDAR